MAFTGTYAVLTSVSCLVCIVAFILHLISFSTSSWLVSDGKSPFIRLGFHEACFQNCYFPYCPGDLDYVYDGCYSWTFNFAFWQDEDSKYQELARWLMKDWFLAARNILIVNIVVMLICSVIFLAATCLALADRYDPRYNKKKDTAFLVLIGICIPFVLVAACLEIVGVCIVSNNAVSRGYMPMSEKNALGYSFYLALVVTIMLGICSVLIFLALLYKVKHLKKANDPTYSEDMMLGRG